MGGKESAVWMTEWKMHLEPKKIEAAMCMAAATVRIAVGRPLFVPAAREAAELLFAMSGRKTAWLSDRKMRGKLRPIGSQPMS